MSVSMSCYACKEGWGPPDYHCSCTRPVPPEPEDRYAEPWMKAYYSEGGVRVDKLPTCRTTVDSGESQDQVNSPSHYRQGNVECIDAMKAQATPEEFRGHLRLNCAKYLWRYNHKGNALEDLKKARWYLDRLIGEVE